MFTRTFKVRLLVRKRTRRGGDYHGWVCINLQQNFSVVRGTECTTSSSTRASFSDLGIPFISWLLSFFFDGLYPAKHIEAAVKEAFRDNRILDNLYATLIETRVAFLVATIRELLCYLFTNYNGVGARDDNWGHRLIRPKDDYSNVRLWEM